MRVETTAHNSANVGLQQDRYNQLEGIPLLKPTKMSATQIQDQLPSDMKKRTDMEEGRRRGPQHPRNIIQTSVTKSPAFFARIGRRMMHNNTPEQPSFDTVSCLEMEMILFDQITIAGLGLAIRTAVAAAAQVEKEKQGTIESVRLETSATLIGVVQVETSFFTSPYRGRRRVPKIAIVIKKNPDAPQLDVDIKKDVVKNETN